MMKKLIKNRPGGFRMSRPKAPLGFGVNKPVAYLAKRNEVFHGVVAEIPRMTFAAPVDVMDMQTFARSAPAARVLIARKNGWLQPPPKRGVLLHQFSPVRSFRATPGGFVRLEITKPILASRAAFLWAAVIYIVVSTVGALMGRTDNAPACLSAKINKVIAVASCMSRWGACRTNFLASAGWFEVFPAVIAAQLPIAVSRLSVRLKCAWSATFPAGGVLHNGDAAARANNGSVSALFHTPDYKDRW